MNLYLISQTKNSGYDTYDSAVVAAESEDQARIIHPAYHSQTDGSYRDERAKWDAGDYFESYDWTTPEHVSVELVGVAADGIEAKTVICSSFNAG